uniref:RagB/SusD family nutrient uptake outer membrane protein n=1 Tax=Pedobacter schmidteae TaxID=2201271 RepID=UPI000EB3B541|nr:RagB/SusD family nutrient uptake outer membrane protein [Pedobacter schmidteae]
MKKYFIIITLLISVSFISCKKFLEEDARSSQTPANFYKSVNDAQAAVNAIYPFLYGPYNKSGYDDMPNTMLEIITGQWNNKAVSPESETYYTLLNTSGSAYTSNFWTNCYKGIESANLVVDNIPGISFSDEADKKSLLAEARFLRAYYYYLLVNIFGDVPLKLTSTKVPGKDGLLPRSAVKEIYANAIVPDLIYAEANLKYVTPVGNGRVSAGAAKTLLAKVYLSMAANPVNDANAMTLAKTKALEVINSNSFSLFQSDANSTWFDKLNNAAFDNKEEHIWDLNYNYPNLQSSLNVYFLPKEVVFTTPKYLQFGGFYPDAAYLDSFNPTDLRGRNNMGFFYNSFTTNSVTYNFPWAVYKFFDKGILTTSPGSGKGFPLLRYADLLLTYAEAQNEADNGPNAAAYKAVNDIRARAGLSPVNGLSKDAFRTEVWKERYWELGAENKTYFDIVRTQQVYDAKKGVFVPIVGFTLPSGAVVKQGYLPFPIPLAEVQINPLLGK